MLLHFHFFIQDMYILHKTQIEIVLLSYFRFKIYFNSSMSRKQDIAQPPRISGEETIQPDISLLQHSSIPVISPASDISSAQFRVTTIRCVSIIHGRCKFVCWDRSCIYISKYVAKLSCCMLQASCQSQLSCQSELSE